MSVILNLTDLTLSSGRAESVTSTAVQMPTHSDFFTSSFTVDSLSFSTFDGVASFGMLSFGPSEFSGVSAKAADRLFASFCQM